MKTNDLSFIQLKKAAKSIDLEKTKAKLVLMGDNATQHLATAIRGYSFLSDYPLNVVDTDYNQIDAQVLDINSELYAEKPDFVLIYMCSEMLGIKFAESNDKTNFADNTYQKIANYWQTIRNNLKTNILQFNFVETNDRVFGNYALKTDESFLYQLKKLNFLMMQGAKDNNVFLIDLNDVNSKLGRDKFFDQKMFYVAKMPISLDALPTVAEQVLDVVTAIKGKIKKCIICDLDNTLWGGVIGDDGLSGIQIGELGVGKAFEDLQRWLKQLKKRGIILGVCSKNDEVNAKLPFEKHPEMILRLDDFSIFVANWEDKASNIKNIQQTLNIGMDSMIFIDDNPFERNLVKSMIPEITVPDLPDDPALYLSCLKSLNLFETASYSENDKDRTKQYQSEVKRINLQKSSESYDDYLKSLEMVATVKPFDEFQTPRIAQLTQRSNQFNLRTVRCTEDDIKRLSKDDSYITRYFMLKDKFGDHGLISVLTMKKKDVRTLFVENWLMSCRVLKRGMEEYIADTMIDIAEKEGFERIVGEYIQTPKNNMVKDLYLKLGFEDIGSNLFEAKVSGYKKHKTYIGE